ncbi:hypothetical protein ACWT_6441 [Actinoplanes sp. SE50]|uniref:hypothetical protein n=1 Tax=unclassified Actinoplanes TaxID=2626549 RepID=UPI00023EBE17|nr:MULTISPECIES: hypothetical protein [unclassified Actinoplanes]AEV87454.1 hypothetical protein ACPL_6572 [Actinoplanes sp. SE50/110]ATO85856.1 hypothetical protein ACWT_6441 [Actinoplanes sp. SE50]SLM03270.1 hypothetical protein ACSP50_6559 [Actinoplanes sp. SE50/110]
MIDGRILRRSAARLVRTLATILFAVGVAGSVVSAVVLLIALTAADRFTRPAADAFITFGRLLAVAAVLYLVGRLLRRRDRS